MNIIYVYKYPLLVISLLHLIKMRGPRGGPAARHPADLGRRGRRSISIVSFTITISSSISLFYCSSLVFDYLLLLLFVVKPQFGIRTCGRRGRRGPSLRRGAGGLPVVAEREALRHLTIIYIYIYICTVYIYIYIYFFLSLSLSIYIYICA